MKKNKFIQYGIYWAKKPSKHDTKWKRPIIIIKIYKNNMVDVVVTTTKFNKRYSWYEVDISDPIYKSFINKRIYKISIEKIRKHSFVKKINKDDIKYLLSIINKQNTIPF